MRRIVRNQEASWNPIFQRRDLRAWGRLGLLVAQLPNVLTEEVTAVPSLRDVMYKDLRTRIKTTSYERKILYNR